uniref:Uncharacterized protein n=1 Tax=Anopheles farauti TaxID=69004 RepID=A0A182Q3Z7_9DIPT
MDSGLMKFCDFHTDCDRTQKSLALQAGAIIFATRTQPRALASCVGVSAVKCIPNTTTIDHDFLIMPIVLAHVSCFSFFLRWSPAGRFYERRVELLLSLIRLVWWSWLVGWLVGWLAVEEAPCSCLAYANGNGEKSINEL